ncbi:hypothetical protein [Streptomyces sp. NPDC005407]|uniref:hypothetical protein n=1 Tax=Streptomyces sp. NPDC005407 TaxID=3155340 RepID=UPI0033A7A5F8
MPLWKPQMVMKVERARVRQEAVWQTRFEALLENLPEPERDAAALELQALIDEVTGSPTGVGAQAGDGGLAVAGGDVHVQAEGGSIAGGVNNFGGEVTLGTRPSQPERERP